MRRCNYFYDYFKTTGGIPISQHLPSVLTILTAIYEYNEIIAQLMFKLYALKKCCTNNKRQNEQYNFKQKLKTSDL